MAGDSLVEKAIERIITINATVAESEMEASFSRTLSEVFGVEKAIIKGEVSQDGASLYGFVANTKKPYIDNQLSEYSSFPELTSYWSKGEKSCAVIPIIVGGRIISLVEMVSKSENRFSQELISGVSTASYLIGLSMLYRKEESKSLMLASYFNSAFAAPPNQLLVSSDGTVVRANAEATSLFGNPQNGKINVDGLFEVAFNPLREKTKGGRELTTRSRTGAKIYSIHANDAGKNMLYLSIKDVTDEERLKQIIGSMNPNYGSGIILLNKELIVTYTTESVKKVIGYEGALILSKSITDLIPEREKVKFKEMIANLQKSQIAYGSMGLLTDKGTISPVRFALSASPTGYMVMFYDASAERYVESMGTVFNEFLDASTDLVIKVDELGYIKSLNHAAMSVLGYERSELKGKPLRSIYQDPSILERDLSFARNGGKVDNSYIQLNTKDRGSVEAINSIRFFKTMEGSEYVIIARELETRRKLKDQEEAIEEQGNRIHYLEKTGEQKSQFIYNISHELKTPLTSIIGFSKLLYSGEFGPVNTDQLEHISTIINEADRLMSIIAQVLDAAKLESDKVKLELGEVDLRALEETPSIKALSESAKNKGLGFSWTVEYDVPNIMADHGRLIQVFVNLIGNSIKFTDKGSIGVKISKKGRRVECDVFDTGIGISEENRYRLFKKFYEPKKTPIKQGGSGTGLGLSITKQIIKLHGGDIRYEPMPDGGSRFSFNLPIKGKRRPKVKPA